MKQYCCYVTEDEEDETDEAVFSMGLREYNVTANEFEFVKNETFNGRFNFV